MRFLSIFLTLLFSAISTAHAAPPSAANFGELPTVYDAAISPDAKRVALFLNVEGSYGIVVVDLSDTDKKPPFAMLGKTVKPEWIKWANNDRILASVWQSDKDRTTPFTAGAIYTLDANTLKGKYLVKPPRGLFRQFNNDVIDFLEDDPDHILN